MKVFFGFLLALAATALGGFPPKPQGVTIVNSKRILGVSITYKEVCSNVSVILLRSLLFQFFSWDEPPMLARSLCNAHWDGSGSDCF